MPRRSEICRGAGSATSVWKSVMRPARRLVCDRDGAAVGVGWKWLPQPVTIRRAAVDTAAAGPPPDGSLLSHPADLSAGSPPPGGPGLVARKWYMAEDSNHAQTPAFVMERPETTAYEDHRGKGFQRRSSMSGGRSQKRNWRPPRIAAHRARPVPGRRLPTPSSPSAGWTAPGHARDVAVAAGPAPGGGRLVRRRPGHGTCRPRR
jgi:hypothetical protein